MPVPYSLMQKTQGSSQCSVGTGLATHRSADNHETVSDNHHFVDLLNFLQEECGTLQIGIFAGLFHRRVHLIVVRLGQFDTRKQITGDTLLDKERV